MIFEHATHWRQWFLKPGFGHVYCMSEPVPGIVVEVEALITGIETRVGIGWPHPRIKRALADGSTILTLTIDHVPEHERELLPYRFGSLLTCVTLVGFMMRTPRVPLTPWGLYKVLRRMGAEVVDG